MAITKYNVSIKVRTQKGEAPLRARALENTLRQALRDEGGLDIQGIRAEVDVPENSY